MYAVIMLVPVYDDCDRHSGSMCYQVEGLPAYETAGIAVRMASRLNASAEGSPYDGDVSYRAFDLRTRRYIVPPAMDDWEDILY